jgi:hypothetical protein
MKNRVKWTLTLLLVSRCRFDLNAARKRGRRIQRRLLCWSAHPPMGLVCTILRTLWIWTLRVSECR